MSTSDRAYAPPALFPIHHASIPYTKPAASLQTLDVWLPRPLAESSPDDAWIVYVHGGAWRDPLQTSTTIHPTLTHLGLTSPSTVRNIAGIASINYRLSPYPDHPRLPSNEKDKSRNVRHAEHVKDVAKGIQYVYEKYGPGRASIGLDPTGHQETCTVNKGEDHKKWKWIAVGHSCGSTLLCQYVSRLGFSLSSAIPGPQALILLESIFSLPSLLLAHSPPHCSPEIAHIYADIVSGAFGTSDPDSETLKSASPTAGRYGNAHDEWPGGRVVMLCHSPVDELVELGQMEEMAEVLKAQSWKLGEDMRMRSDGAKGRDEIGDTERRLMLRYLEGDHDFIWKDGRQIAQAIEDVLGMLTAYVI